VSIDTYRRFWNDNEVSSIGLRLRLNADPGEVSHDLQEEFSDVQRLAIQPNQDLKEEVLAVIEGTLQSRWHCRYWQHLWHSWASSALSVVGA
jgi:hypothetical protein